MGRPEAVLLLVVSAVVLTGCDGNDPKYNLYRTSVVLPDPIYVASFDANEGNMWNYENCTKAAEMMNAEPGLRVTYFCRLQ